MKRAYYSASVPDFLQQEDLTVLGALVQNNQFVLEDNQRNTWIQQIRILKESLSAMKDGYLLFEYVIPRIGRRIDNVLMYRGLVFLLEFKIGEHRYQQHDIDQVTDYALDLKNFHEESHNRLLIPILICTRALAEVPDISMMKDGILNVLKCNSRNFCAAIDKICEHYHGEALSPDRWVQSPYKPTPTIIEAAQKLYRSHSVADISRNDGGAINLSHTTDAVNCIIDRARQRNEKAICFITGVPGAGKTLAGLNIAVERQRIAQQEQAVFLSGNGPLVRVLQEALARDQTKREKMPKKQAIRSTNEFIQMIHHFRDDALSVDTPPSEKVIVFDEAQRAWTQEMLSKFMEEKKHVVGFAMSEPEFLISIMDRHDDWAVIINLVGGGQEINTGEAGLAEWFAVLRAHYPNWHIYVSNQITDSEYVGQAQIEHLLQGTYHTFVPYLHLSVPIRSFRSDKLSGFVKALLEVDIQQAQVLYKELHKLYPIFLTRDIHCAKKWIRGQAHGTERYGMVASSGARRLKTYGIWVQNKIDAPLWFLNDKEDVRSSYFMEDTATEFDIQGLELDWALVCWDADLRFEKEQFGYYAFKGKRWQHVNKQENIRYLINAYRVLLTRARQGMVIFIPEGDPADNTRQGSFYDRTYVYLKQLGIREIGDCSDIQMSYVASN